MASGDDGYRTALDRDGERFGRVRDLGGFGDGNGLSARLSVGRAREREQDDGGEQESEKCHGED